MKNNLVINNLNLKKRIIKQRGFGLLAVSVVLSAVFIFGCKLPKPTQEDVDGTMDLVLNVYATVDKSLRYEIDLEGFSIEINEETQSVTYVFDHFDLNSLYQSVDGVPMGYTEMDGALSIDLSGHFYGDLTLKDGPVETFVLDNQAEEKILANGYSFSLTQ